MPAGDLTQGYIFVPAEKNIDQVKMNAIVGQAYINPAFISGQTGSSSTTTGDYFLLYKAGGTLAKILYDDLASSLAAATGFQSQIWSTRQKSFNAVGNPNFAVTQRNCGNGVVVNGTSLFIEDRWKLLAIGGMVLQGQSVITGVNDPATGFPITVNFLSVNLNTPKVTLAAGDVAFISQIIEGSTMREIMSGVHSISLLVSCTSPLKFGVTMRDSGSSGTATKSLSKLCTYTGTGAWQTFQLPNLPVIAAGGNWGLTPGGVGYELDISLASGSTFMAPANDTWQNGNFTGAVGQDNFAALATNSKFQVAMVQHEPGPQCTTLIDKPFSQNLDEAQRYFAKTYSYPITVGTVTYAGANCTFFTNSATSAAGCAPFPKRMAKVPTVNIYSPQTGTVNNMVDRFTGTSIFATPTNIGDTGFEAVTTSGATVSHNFSLHYTADTGW
jgi:hypothetical protein